MVTANSYAVKPEFFRIGSKLLFKYDLVLSKLVPSRLIRVIRRDQANIFLINIMLKLLNIIL